MHGFVGEWWNEDVEEIEKQGNMLGLHPNMSDAHTINGKLGPLFPCSEKRKFIITTHVDDFDIDQFGLQDIDQFGFGFVFIFCLCFLLQIPLPWKSNQVRPILFESSMLHSTMSSSSPSPVTP